MDLEVDVFFFCYFTIRFTGDDIAYIYSDLDTALRGRFDNGTLVRGRAARIEACRWW